MKDREPLSCTMNQTLYWIKQELEASGFDKVFLTQSRSHFFCFGDGSPDSFSGFRMIFIQSINQVSSR